MRFFLIVISCLQALLLGAEPPSITAADYIQMWKDEAVYQMAVHRIPASITLAQAMLESGNGNSRLAVNGNNHFGIKCHNDWTGKTIREDDETRNECFRKYADASQSFEDHSLFLQRKRYEPLFQLEVDDYKAWAKGLKECGYATNPKYPQLLIRLIEENNLHQYDKAGKLFIEKNEVPDRPGGKKARPIIATDTKNKDRNNAGTDLPTEINLSTKRTIKVSGNRIRYVVAEEGDTPKKIAEDVDLHAGLIKRYNDLEDNSPLDPGEIIYLQPKRNKGAEETYTVKSGDTWRSISQSSGVKMKKILSRNKLLPSDDPVPGKTLLLR